MAKHSRITLTKQERQKLKRLVSTLTKQTASPAANSPKPRNVAISAKTARAAAKKLIRGRILLLMDCSKDGPAHSIPEIAAEIGCTRAIVEGVRRRFLEGGVELVLHRPRPPHADKRRLDEEAEAQLVALARSTPPRCYEWWPLRMLAERMVELKYVESISHETVRKILKRYKGLRTH